MVRPATKSKPRIDRKVYVAEALVILEEEGFQGLTIAAVVERLGVTKGSFYHHFEGWDDFRQGLLSFWEESQTERLIELAEMVGSPRERASALIDMASNFPHRIERELRAWGATDAEVGSAVRRVDSRRRSYGARTFNQILNDDAAAQRLAATGLAVLVGAQQLYDDLSPDRVYDMLALVQAALFAETEGSRDSGTTDPRRST